MIRMLPTQEEFGGRFVAMRDGRVVENAPTNRQLLDKVRARGLDFSVLAFAYVRPVDCLRVLAHRAA